MSQFIVCNNEKEIHENCSCWGNERFVLTKEDLEALKQGKTLAGDVNEEYGIFISLAQEEQIQ